MKYKDYEIVKTNWTTGTPARPCYKIIKDNKVVADHRQMLGGIEEAKEYIDIVLMSC